MPLVVSFFIYIEKNNGLAKGTSPLFPELCIILGSNVVSVFIAILIIFVNWKRGPAWWLRVSPSILRILCIILYLVIPVANFVSFLYFFIHPDLPLKKQPISSYLIFYISVCFNRVIEFRTQIRKELIKEILSFAKQ